VPSVHGAFPCILYVVLYHAIAAGSLVWWHAREHHVINVIQVCLAVFCVINGWICVCEIALFVYPKEIQQQHAAFSKQYGDCNLPPVFLFERATVTEVLSLRYWAIMWSTYCALDPSYADTTTFGYCVDVGNGVTTLLPSMVYAVGMTSAVLSPRALGMVGLIFFYQMLYGTLLYFFQYVNNRRFDRSTRAQVWGIVVPANGIWIAFPLLGLWASSQLILDGTFEIFRDGIQL